MPARSLPASDVRTDSGDGDDAELRRRISGFQVPQQLRSLAETVVSLGGYIAISALMYVAAERTSYWIALALTPLAAAFLVRTFIIQHDCGHGSLFRARWMNGAVGFACSLFTLAPYLSWRRQHAGHHGIWNNLDRRETGADIYSSCLTVEEYLGLGPWRRRAYRLTRHPLVANVLLPPLVFLGLYRFPFDIPKRWRRERRGVHLTNLALTVLITGLGLTLGFGRVAAVQLPVIALAAIVGVWLFTVQHRSSETVWARETDWNEITASLRGSTYLRLTPVLQWLTGNIGFHHVHHLDPRVPNYRLRACHDAIAHLCDVPAVTLADSFRVMRNVLWDEQSKRMVTFRALLSRRAGEASRHFRPPVKFSHSLRP